MKTITIEFFHDVLCAWCFAISPRLRRLVNEYENIEVIHRSFALAPSPQHLINMFGDKETARKEIMEHWRNANENDDEKRINTASMEMRKFDYPFSLPGLRACKAAELQGGQKAHWDMFDRVQRAHFIDTENIADLDVLIKCASDLGFDLELFEKDFKSENVVNLVYQDINRARKVGINAVPTLLINDRKIIRGAQKYETIKEVIDSELAVM
jgi:predicted DsbA family dithiol-disulfide isomerase